MRVPHIAALWNYGKRPAVALLESMLSEQRMAYKAYHEAFKAKGEPREQLTTYYKVANAHIDCIERIQNRLRDVQKWPDSP